MRNTSVKRTFNLFVETSENPAAEFYFPSARKHVKKGLSIEIADSFADPYSPGSMKPFANLPASPSLAHKLSDFPLFTPKSSRLPNPSSTYHQASFSFNFGSTSTSRSEYDDFYRKGSFYDVTMRKCHRKTMEDRTVAEPELSENRFNDKFFGVYDGHTSSSVSDFLQKNFHNMLASHTSFNEDPKIALKESFERADKQILESGDINGGSTALCAIFRGTRLYLANAGDSKAVLISKNEVKDITREHRASNEEEKLRVESQGGVIIVHKSRSLVQGSLEITRSLGDKKYKKYISCEPDIFEHEITSDDQMIIMATDGFWEVMSNHEVLELVKANDYQTQGLSQVLVEAAIKKRSHGLDNISLVAIYLPELVKSH